MSEWTYMLSGRDGRVNILGFIRYSWDVNEFKPQNKNTKSFWEELLSFILLIVKKNFIFLGINIVTIYIFILF